MRDDGRIGDAEPTGGGGELEDVGTVARDESATAVLPGRDGEPAAEPAKALDIPEWVSEIRRLYVEPKHPAVEDEGTARHRRASLVRRARRGRTAPEAPVPSALTTPEAGMDADPTASPTKGLAALAAAAEEAAQHRDVPEAAVFSTAVASEPGTGGEPAGRAAGGPAAPLASPPSPVGADASPAGEWSDAVDGVPVEAVGGSVADSLGDTAEPALEGSESPMVVPNLVAADEAVPHGVTRPAGTDDLEDESGTSGAAASDAEPLTAQPEGASTADAGPAAPALIRDDLSDVIPTTQAQHRPEIDVVSADRASGADLQVLEEASAEVAHEAVATRPIGPHADEAMIAEAAAALRRTEVADLEEAWRRPAIDPERPAEPTADDDPGDHSDLPDGEVLDRGDVSDDEKPPGVELDEVLEQADDTGATPDDVDHADDPSADAGSTDEAIPVEDGTGPEDGVPQRHDAGDLLPGEDSTEVDAAGLDVVAPDRAEVVGDEVTVDAAGLDAPSAAEAGAIAAGGDEPVPHEPTPDGPAPHEPAPAVVTQVVAGSSGNEDHEDDEDDDLVYHPPPVHLSWRQAGSLDFDVPTVDDPDHDILIEAPSQLVAPPRRRHDHSARSAHDPAPDPETAALTEEAALTAATRAQMRAAARQESSRGRVGKWLAVAAVALLVVIAAVWFLVRGTGSRDTAAPAQAATTTVTAWATGALAGASAQG